MKDTDKKVRNKKTQNQRLKRFLIHASEDAHTHRLMLKQP